ncbi:MAG: PKD domain-containing protein [Bacteroidota bacterium]
MADKNSACSSPATFQFTNQSTGNGLTYQRDFGDGQSEHFERCSHSYSKVGTSTVVLKVRDSNRLRTEHFIQCKCRQRRRSRLHGIII